MHMLQKGVANANANAIWLDASMPEIDEAVRAADSARSAWGELSHFDRAAVLRALGTRLRAHRDGLAELALAETSLPLSRLDGEIERTAFQLEHFADMIVRGEHLGILIEDAVPGGPPSGHPDLRRINVSLSGPIAVFAASNFPFAFSVLGGDTASALAAGCVVVVKAHPGHPKTSAAVAEVAHQVLEEHGLPSAVVALVTCERDSAAALVGHSLISAVGFTGSVAGGRALADIAAARDAPIPFFGELGSVNPFIVMPTAARTAADELAEILTSSITAGVGQFCTRPGLVLVPDSAAGDELLASLAARLNAAPSGPMLTAAILGTYQRRISECLETGAVTVLAGAAGIADSVPCPTLVTTSANAFILHAALRAEIFGPAALAVRYSEIRHIEEVLKEVRGCLAVTFFCRGDDYRVAQRLVPIATRVAGRIVFDEVPTGVAIAHAQTHGGPYPASTAPASTSVGFMAIHRFLRPVTFQGAPDELLPKELARANPLMLSRNINGSINRAR